VRPLDVPMLGLLGCLTRSGTGAWVLAGRVLGASGAGAEAQDIDEGPGKELRSS
jgi:hypothetical protein